MNNYRYPARYAVNVMTKPDPMVYPSYYAGTSIWCASWREVRKALRRVRKTPLVHRVTITQNRNH